MLLVCCAVRAHTHILRCRGRFKNWVSSVGIEPRLNSVCSFFFLEVLVGFFFVCFLIKYFLCVKSIEIHLNHRKKRMCTCSVFFLSANFFYLCCCCELNTILNLWKQMIFCLSFFVSFCGVLRPFFRGCTLCAKKPLTHAFIAPKETVEIFFYVSMTLSLNFFSWWSVKSDIILNANYAIIMSY